MCRNPINLLIDLSDLQCLYIYVRCFVLSLFLRYIISFGGIYKLTSGFFIEIGFTPEVLQEKIYMQSVKFYIDLRCGSCRFFTIKTTCAMSEFMKHVCQEIENAEQCTTLNFLIFPLSWPMFSLFWNPRSRDGNAGKGVIHVYVYLYNLGQSNIEGGIYGAWQRFTTPLASGGFMDRWIEGTLFRSLSILSIASP